MQDPPGPRGDRTIQHSKLRLICRYQDSQKKTRAPVNARVGGSCIRHDKTLLMMSLKMHSIGDMKDRRVLHQGHVPQILARIYDAGRDRAFA